MMEAFNKQVWQEALDAIVEPPEATAFAPLETATLAIVMVEFREHDWLRPTLWNLAHVYSQSSTALVIVCGRLNSKRVADITRTWKNVVIRVLEKDNCTIPEYNALLTSSSFYELFDPCPVILLTQTDTLTRKRVPASLIEKYGYIGAPWFGPQISGPLDGVVGNGGYSLRRVRDMKAACDAHLFDPDADHAEDLFFAKYAPNIAPREIANLFSVEHVPHEDPCGMHQAWRFHRTELVRHWLKNLPGTRNAKKVVLL